MLATLKGYGDEGVKAELVVANDTDKQPGRYSYCCTPPTNADEIQARKHPAIKSGISTCNQNEAGYRK